MQKGLDGSGDADKSDAAVVRMTRHGTLQPASWMIDLLPTVEPQARRLVEPHQRQALDAAIRLFVAQVSNTQLSANVVSEFVNAHGARAIIAATHALADAFRRQTHDLSDEAKASVLGTLNARIGELITHLDPAGTLSLEWDVRPRPTLVTALAELQAMAAANRPQPEPRPGTFVRVRAKHSAHTALTALRASTSWTMLPSAMDEWIVTAPHDPQTVRALVGHVVRCVVDLDDVTSIAGRVQLVDDLDDSVQLHRAHADAASWQKPGTLALPAELRDAVAEQFVVDNDGCVALRFANFTARLEQSALLHRAPFLAREREVARIAEFLSSPLARAGLCVVKGMSGAGKSALVRQALRRTHADPMAPVLWGGASPTVHTPLAAIAAMLRALIGVLPGSLHARTRLDDFVKALAQTADEQTGHLLLRQLPVFHDLIASADDDERLLLQPRPRRSIHHAFALLLRAMHQRGDGRPVVVVVGQAEALDSGTRALLLHAAQKLGGALRLVWLTTQRPRLSHGFEASCDIVHEHLTPLDENAMRDIATQVLSQTPDATVEQIALRCQGHPLLLQQSLRLWIETGDAALVMRLLRVPSTARRVAAVCLERLRALPESAKRVLAGAAMFERRFAAETLEHWAVTMGLTRDAVHSAIALLCDIGVLVRSEPRAAAPVMQTHARDTHALLAFEHPTLRDAADHLTTEKRTQAHRAAAQALEATCATTSVAVAPALVHHLRMSGDVAQARRHALRATRHALRLMDSARARTFASVFLADGDMPPHDAFAFHEALVAGQHARASQQDLQHATAVAEATADPVVIQRAYVLRAEHALRAAHADGAQQMLVSASQLGPDTSALLRLQCLVALARGEALPAQLPRLRPSLGSWLSSLAAHNRHDHCAALMHAMPVHQHAVADDDLAAQAAALALAAEVLPLAHDADGLAARVKLLTRAVALWRQADEVRHATTTHLDLIDAHLAFGDTLAAQEACRDFRTHSDDQSAAALAVREVMVASANADDDDIDALETSVWQHRRRAAHHEEPAILIQAALLKCRHAMREGHVVRERLLKRAETLATSVLHVPVPTPAARHLFHANLCATALGAHVVLARVGLLRHDVGAAFAHAQAAFDASEEAIPCALADDAVDVYLTALALTGDDEERHTQLTRHISTLHARARLVSSDFWRHPARQPYRFAHDEGAQ